MRSELKLSKTKVIPNLFWISINKFRETENVPFLQIIGIDEIDGIHNVESPLK